MTVCKFFKAMALLLLVSGALMNRATAGEEKCTVPVCVTGIRFSDMPTFPDEFSNKIHSTRQEADNGLRGRCLTADETRSEIHRLCNKVNKLFLDNGYLTTRSECESVVDGVITLQIIAGTLSKIDIENEVELDRLKPSYIETRLRRGAKEGEPVNYDLLESHLRLLQMDPAIDHVEANIKPTEQRGKSDLGIRIKESRPLSITVSADNYSPYSIGSERFGVCLNLLNPSFWPQGDQLSASYYQTTTGGGKLIDGTYQAPVNAMNGSVMFRGSLQWTEVTDPEFEALDLEGDRVLYEGRFRQPLFRDYLHELALSLGFKYTDGQTFVFEGIGTPFGWGPDEEGVSRTSVISFSQDYVRRVSKRVWFVESKLNWGVDVFDATINPEPIPDGEFFSWIGYGYLAQQLFERQRFRQTLVLQAALQLSDDGLLASEQFVIGGGQSVRGYRQNARIGDNGYRVSIEDRISLITDKAGHSILEVQPFVDMGSTWNVSDNPNEQQSQRFLIGAGVGILANLGGFWEPLRDLWLRFDYGYPFVDLDDKGSNAQDKGIYFSVNYEPNRFLDTYFRK